MVGNRSRKTRRGKRKSHKKDKNVSTKTWSILQTNIRNFDSKKESLNSILSNNSFSLVIYNETHFRSGRKAKIPNYVTYCRNRVDKSSGGIATSVKEEDAKYCVRIDEGKSDNEFIVTRHSQFMVPINVINVYGQQECRTPKETIERHWKELLEIVNDIEARKELLVMVGDFNHSLGSKTDKNEKLKNY